MLLRRGGGKRGWAERREQRSRERRRRGKDFISPHTEAVKVSAKPVIKCIMRRVLVSHVLRERKADAGLCGWTASGCSPLRPLGLKVKACCLVTRAGSLGGAKRKENITFNISRRLLRSESLSSALNYTEGTPRSLSWRRVGVFGFTRREKRGEERRSQHFGRGLRVIILLSGRLWRRFRAAVMCPLRSPTHIFIILLYPVELPLSFSFWLFSFICTSDH